MRAPMLALLLAASGLAACSKYESSGLRGAGSMRVEVEVYKGPLGQDPAIQIGELGAVLAETVRVVRNWTDAATRYYPTCKARNVKLIDHDCRPLEDAIESGEEIIFSICDIFPSRVHDVEVTFNGAEHAGLEISRKLDNACARNLTIQNDLQLPVLGSTRKYSDPSVELIKEDRDEIARRIARGC